MGFNITHIDPVKNQELQPYSNAFKAQSNESKHLGYQRQTISEIESFDWDNSTGIGAILGFNSLRALDFDGSNSLIFIKEVLSYLGLPSNYEWVIKSGSGNGFHIIFYSENHSFPVHLGRIRAFKPDSENAFNFKRLELRWAKHLVLPPSLHFSGQQYSFYFCDLPLKKPQFVKINLVEDCVKNLCYENGGYNTAEGELDVSSYYYYQEEALDISPIFVEKIKISKKLKQTREELLNQYGINYFYHLTHKSNLESILNNGLLSHNEARLKKFIKTDIADNEVNKRRARRDPIYGMSIHDYVPLYFNPKNPMLFKRKEIQDDILILAIDKEVIFSPNSIFTEGNAASKETLFFREINSLKNLHWACINSEFWNDISDGKRKKCAELLVFPEIPITSIKKIFVNTEHTKQYVLKKLKNNFKIQVETNTKMFYNNSINESPQPNSKIDNPPFKR